MNPSRQQWQKLTALARQADQGLELVAPYGFATRIVAKAMCAPAISPWALIERYALRGLVAAAVFSVATVAFNYVHRTTETMDDYTGADTVVDVLNLS